MKPVVSRSAEDVDLTLPFHSCLYKPVSLWIQAISGLALPLFLGKMMIGSVKSVTGFPVTQLDSSQVKV